MQLIKKRFKKAIKTYDKNAIVQNMMASNLIQKISEHCGKKFPKILEIGCGTGLLTRKIAKNIEFEEFFSNDIVEDHKKIINKIIPNSLFICENIEKANIEAEFDLIISNATFQWIKSFEKFQINLQKMSKNNSIIAFTTFGIENFREIKEITGLGLKYKTTTEIKEMFNKNFKLIYEKEEILQLEFNSPFDILKHISSTGTNAVCSTKWTKNDLNTFCQKYLKMYETEEKLKLTYNPLYFIFERSCL
ncbi:MAG: malonyl-ACP O-methyltransferase BioC [Candidatus Gastranaerophilaceae bacterium]|jgi:malonyl-ACP O-methyltransferase BioC